MLDENKWLAARHGLDGELVDLPSRDRVADAASWPGGCSTACASTPRTSARPTSSTGSTISWTTATAPQRQVVVYEANHDFGEVLREIVAATVD